MDYNALVSNIDDWLARGDLSGNADHFIGIAQKQAERVLRIAPMEKWLNETITGDGFAEVPSDYLELKDAFIFDGGASTPTLTESGYDDFPPYDFRELGSMYYLNRTSAERIYRDFGDRIVGGNATLSLPDNIERQIARSGDTFLIRPNPGSDFTLGGIYYGRFATISVGSPSNWLTDNAEDVLFFGALREAAAYNKSAGEEEYWGKRFGEAIAQLIQQEDEESFSGSALQMRVA